MDAPINIPPAGGVGLVPGQLSRKRPSFTRVVPEQGKKRVNYGKGDARRIMEEAVSLCEAMTLGYEVVFHGRRRSSAAHRTGTTGDGIRCVLEACPPPKYGVSGWRVCAIYVCIFCVPSIVIV